MEDSYAYPQGVQSVSGTVDVGYEQIRMSGQPINKPQMQSATTTTTGMKVILWLLGAVVLVALVVAVVALILNMQQNYVLMEKITSLDQMMHELQADHTKTTGSELPNSSPTGPSPSISPTTPALTASSPTTHVSSTDTRLTSCAVIHSSHPSAPSGVYTIHIGGSVQGREVWCDMVTDGGGWTRFQRRQDGSVRFSRTWSEYKSGFGSDAEFWLGNDYLHTLTATQPSELRIDLWEREGNYRYATYANFQVDNETVNYRIHVSGYSGTAGDALDFSNNMPFSTADQDHDIHSSVNCAAVQGGGGWWFRACSHSNLNSRYYHGDVENRNGVYWINWNYIYSYKATSMMTRLRQ